MEKMSEQPKKISPEVIFANQTLAFYLKGVLNRVPLMEQVSTEPKTRKSMAFLIPDNCVKNVTVFNPDGSEIYFIQINLNNQFSRDIIKTVFQDGGPGFLAPSLMGAFLAGVSWGFSISGQYPTILPNSESLGEYELVYFALDKLNQLYPQYFPNFWQFEKSLLKGGEENGN